MPDRPTTHRMIERPTWRLGSSAALVVAGAGLAAAVIAGDIADSSHAAWRDPISYFGSPQAPHPGLFNAALAVLGCVIVVWSLVRLPFGPRVPLVLVAVAGAASVALATWTIDCSPVDDLCEVMIRADVTSGAHDMHSYVAVLLFGSLAAITVEHAIVRRRTVHGLGRWIVGVTVVAGVGGMVVLIGRAFSAGSGAVEVAAAAGALVALRYRLGATGTTSGFTPRGMRG